MIYANNGNNWGATGGTVDVHRMNRDWTELGATWNCANDSNISNSSPDCPTEPWEMDKPNHPELWPYFATSSASILITNDQTGTVEFDVTSDLQAFFSGQTPNYGWLIRKTEESLAGLVEFGSRETSQGPKLIITYKL